jgi:hypothetical protein
MQKLTSPSGSREVSQLEEEAQALDMPGQTKLTPALS